MAKLSRSQIATLARNAGFTGKDVDIAVAVALAESGGDPSAHNPVGKDNSYGLWQINMLGAMGPDRRKRLGIASNTALFDPTTNARAAYMVWKSQGWAGWTTYTRGTYKKFMTGDNGSNTATPVSGSVSGLNPTLSVTSAIDNFGANFLKGFASFGAVAVALVLFILGVVILLRGKIAAISPAGKLGKVAKVAKKVT